MLKSMICQLWRSLSHCPTLVFTAAPLRRAALRGHGERERERKREREEERGGGVSARRALTLIHFHIYTPHVCMSGRRRRRRRESLVKEWICAQRRASFFFFFVLRTESQPCFNSGGQPASPAPRTPLPAHLSGIWNRTAPLHIRCSHRHTQAESWCVGGEKNAPKIIYK